ncbi:hypothetical protein QG37_01951 [Candidozyma auris]|uniref:Uncharacterized protein n=1 Tax=Candidozyma auris TaxID=498019 RepID=A0A0L0P3Y3_CANAR|nr:hypothetical protein QG37_01951 [[Candida] auris]
MMMMRTSDGQPAGSRVAEWERYRRQQHMKRGAVRKWES